MTATTAVRNKTKKNNDLHLLQSNKLSHCLFGLALSLTTKKKKLPTQKKICIGMINTDCCREMGIGKWRNL